MISDVMLGPGFFTLYFKCIERNVGELEDVVLGEQRNLMGEQRNLELRLHRYYLH